MEEHLGDLRERLDYHHRLEASKEEIARLAAERDEHRNARDEQHARYIEAKDNWRALHRKYTERKQLCANLTQTAQIQDAEIRGLRDAVRAANDKLMKQNIANSKANTPLENTVAQLKVKEQELERDKMKLKKKVSHALSVALYPRTDSRYWI